MTKIDEEFKKIVDAVLDKKKLWMNLKRSSVSLKFKIGNHVKR